MRYFEDFADDFVFDFHVSGISEEEIKAFASHYDPQRFHLEESDAAATHFGGLVASGFQTQLLCFRPFCEQILVHTSAIGAPGIDNLTWHRPWYPNEPLQGSVKLVTKRISSKHLNRGYIRFHLEAFYEDKLTLSMDWRVMILLSEAA